ncbi:DUF2946 family protein [Deinococcus sp. YIM 134068]|uniref:DUF2946 family protein n=1 Tax=Deinococcus lichenicola TaxID=3118910 RepID=UPI002F95BE22
MTWPRPLLPMRPLLALLVLIAAFTYSLRLGPGMGAGETHRPTGAAHHEHRHGEAAQDIPTLPSHAAHCLFCLTGAFALMPGPDPTLPPTGPAPRVDRAPTPRAAHGLPSPPQARAPPSHPLI